MGGGVKRLGWACPDAAEPHPRDIGQPDNTHEATKSFSLQRMHLRARFSQLQNELLRRTSRRSGGPY
ncbi:hypothetical protein GCM10022213_21070 [Parerythrobacter jejuensis]